MTGMGGMDMDGEICQEVVVREGRNLIAFRSHDVRVDVAGCIGGLIFYEIVHGDTDDIQQTPHLNEIRVREFYGIEWVHPAHGHQLHIRVEFIDDLADGVPVLHKALAAGLQRGQVLGKGSGDIGPFLCEACDLSDEFSHGSFLIQLIGDVAQIQGTLCPERRQRGEQRDGEEIVGADIQSDEIGFFDGICVHVAPFLHGMIVHEAHQRVHGGIAFIALIQHVAQFMGAHGGICHLDEFLGAHTLGHFGMVGVVDFLAAVAAVGIRAEAGGDAVAKAYIGVIVGNRALCEDCREARQQSQSQYKAQDLLPGSSSHMLFLLCVRAPDEWFQMGMETAFVPERWGIDADGRLPPDKYCFTNSKTLFSQEHGGEILKNAKKIVTGLPRDGPIERTVKTEP